MKKIFKILAFILGGLIGIILITWIIFYIKWNVSASHYRKFVGEEAPVLSAEGFTFRDLNKNGVLDTYEDSRANIEARIDNIISQMTIGEKAGLMFIHMATYGKNGEVLQIPKITNPFSLIIPPLPEMMFGSNMNHFNVVNIPAASDALKWYNNVQKYAERTRLGIPVTIASDPTHGKGFEIGTAVGSQTFTRWPSQLGFGAIDDTILVREFGDIARQEYLALGIRVALHPQADLGTEPRWMRINSVFSEDAYLAARLTKAYILGFQGDSIGPTSVACMTKHFSGGGPQEDGLDAHFASGKKQVYPGNNFDYHLIPFIDGAFAAGTSQIMPYYGIPYNQTSENVGFAFNLEIIQNLLRDSLGFNGIVCTDWAIITDLPVKEASAWGVEQLSPKERVEKVLSAGCDMFGGESVSGLVVELVNEGKISETRIDQSIRRILREKFRMGLFDNPYLNASSLVIFDNQENREKGLDAQRRSMVLLKNDNTLPLSSDQKVYVQGMPENIDIDFGNVVDSPEEADFIVLKLQTPSTPASGGGLMERMFKQGRLDFPEDEKEELLELINSKPTITVMSLGRPPVIPEINAASKAVIADFENEDRIILEMIYGKFNPTGKLPLEIPSSVAAVDAQLEDVPYDSKDPLYAFGFGLSYN